MTFDQINPLTGKVKEYANSAEWMRDVEAYRAQNQTETPRAEVHTYADAARRLNEELGIRNPVAEKEAAVAELIERKVAEGVSSALERQQAEKAQQAQKAEKVSQSLQADQPPAHFDAIGKCLWKALHAPKTGRKCGCKAEGHKPAAEPVIHSRRGVGPVMTARALTAAEAETRLKQAGITL